MRRGGARRRPTAPAQRQRPQRASSAAAAAAHAARGLNENYARELLELHTLGVDGGYTQQDIVERRARVHRLDDRQPRQGGGFRVRRAACTIAARRRCSARRSRPAAASTTASACSTSSRAHPSTARHIAHEARAALRQRQAARGARRSRRGEVPRRPRAICARSCATIVDVAGVLSRRTRTARRSRRRSSSWSSALRATGADVGDGAAARARRCATWACRSTSASRRPATTRRPTRG